MNVRRLSDHQLRRLADTIPQVLWIVRANGAIQYVNGRVADLTESAQNERGIWEWRSVVHPDDSEDSLHAWINAVRTKQPFELEQRLAMRDGGYRWHLTRAFPELDEHGDAQRWYVTSTDIHDLKQAAVELEHRRRQVESLVEHSPDLVARFDRDLRYLYLNSAVQAITGLAPEACLGKTLGELGLPNDRVATWNALARDVLENRQTRTFDFAFQTLHGDRHYWTRLMPEGMPGGPVETLLVVAHDITEQKRAEEERRNVLNSIAHDIRNPLAALKVQAQLITRRLERGNVELEQVATLASALNDSIDRMAARVDELSGLAAVEAGLPIDLEPQPADLVALVSRCVEEARKSSGDHKIRFETSEASAPGVWDVGRIDRVISNLLANAVKYSPDRREVEVRLTLQPRQAVVQVSDQGIGIPEADIPHIFAYGFRGANVGAISGTGVGLAASKQIVEQHGGSLEVESEIGRGSTFTLRLPLADAAHGEQP
jgi:PAS domain S-box-containing protein